MANVGQVFQFLIGKLIIEEEEGEELEHETRFNSS